MTLLVLLLGIVLLGVIVLFAHFVRVFVSDWREFRILDWTMATRCVLATLFIAFVVVVSRLVVW